jgi:hypothetical protein
LFAFNAAGRTASPPLHDFTSALGTLSDVRDTTHEGGAIGLQHDAKTGTSRFRNIWMREIDQSRFIHAAVPD